MDNTSDSSESPELSPNSLAASEATAKNEVIDQERESLEMIFPVRNFPNETQLANNFYFGSSPFL